LQLLVTVQLLGVESSWARCWGGVACRCKRGIAWVVHWVSGMWRMAHHSEGSIRGGQGGQGSARQGQGLGLPWQLWPRPCCALAAALSRITVGGWSIIKLSLGIE
jgi:hypothetical protein